MLQPYIKWLRAQEVSSSFVSDAKKNWLLTLKAPISLYDFPMALIITSGRYVMEWPIAKHHITKLEKGSFSAAPAVTHKGGTASRYEAARLFRYAKSSFLKGQL